jgi:hypothetical protein
MPNQTTTEITVFDPPSIAGRLLIEAGFPRLLTQALDICQRAGAIQVSELNLPEAITLFNDLKMWERQVESIELKVSDPFELVLKIFKGSFKPLKDKLEVKARLSRQIQDVKSVVEERERTEHNRAEAERRAALEMGNLPELGGQGVVSGLVNPIPVPTNVREGLDGSKVHTRTYLDVEVVDKEALLKTILSKTPANSYLTLDLIDIRLAQLKKALEAKWESEGEKSKKKPPPGVTTSERKVLV